MFYRMKTDEKEILEIIKMFFLGFPISNIPKVKMISEQTVRNILSKAVQHFDRYENLKINYDDYVPEVIEVDEIYIKLQGQIQFYAWLAYDPKNKFIIDFEVGKRDVESLERLFKRLKHWRTKVKLVLVDGYKGFEQVIRKYLGRTRNKPLTGVINKSKFVKNTNKFFTYAMFGKGRKSVEDMIKEIGIGNEISTCLIENLNGYIRDQIPYMKRRSKRNARLLSWVRLAFKGLRFIKNTVKAHWALSFKSSKNWISIPITPIKEMGVVEKNLDLYDILNTPTLN